ncbi:MAG TPA: TIGR00730 family Rossman fold protein [Caulobacteraceae bacterium]|jgi:hypothetical protein
MAEAAERRTRRVDSVCLYCGSSNDADPAFLAAAGDFGRHLAANGARLVYGGGGVGLMGAAARAAHEAGGRVLGIIPEFLTDREGIYGAVETVVVNDMPTRKLRMFEESDAFAVLPGGIGTLEEIIELLSWKRLDLHRKPVVFLNIQGFWDPLFELFQHTVDARLTPPAFTGAYAAVDRVEAILPALEAQAAEA